MASELLSIPEENLREVIKVIRYGLKVDELFTGDISQDVREQLEKFCSDEEEYLKRLEEV